VQIKVKPGVLAMLKGLRVQGAIKIMRDGRVLREAAGEVLFAQDGLSGIAAMEVSREAAPGTAAVLDLLPEYSIEELTALLSRWQDCLSSPRTPTQLLSGLLPGRVAEAVTRSPRPSGTPSRVRLLWEPLNKGGLICFIVHLHLKALLLNYNGQEGGCQYAVSKYGLGFSSYSVSKYRS
jgi:hypothetical protein